VSTFSGLNTANTALSAAQRAMDVTGQNIANVNTDGYSRQRVNLKSVGGTAVPAMYAVSSQVGEGVNSDDVGRIRDAFLEGRAQVEHGTTASLTSQAGALSQVEQAFREPGDTGIQAMLSNMWAGWGDVAKAPADLGARAQLLQRTETLVAGMHSTSAALDGHWSQARDNLSTLVTDANATASSIADLNQAVKRATQAGLPSNELQDKRDLLVMHLSEQLGATATRMDDGTLNVVVGGTTLVAGNTALRLALTGSSDPAKATASPPLLTTVPGNTTIIPGGTADGDLQTMTSIIPRYRAKLDAVAQQLADQVNGLHQNSLNPRSFDLNGNPGIAVFDDGKAATSGITAANIALAIKTPDQLAAATLSPAQARGKPSTDAGNADALYQLRLDGNGSDASYRQMIVALGVESTTTGNDLATQSVINTQVDASRESSSGVNLDEEMTNMLQFQHGYAAAGRLVSTINTMLDDLMNMVR
jgi:flagellar hook-associated protein 1 FlgK